ncbi:hypothetical protein D3C76_1563970 [compost metagenome]
MKLSRNEAFADQVAEIPQAYVRGLDIADYPLLHSVSDRTAVSIAVDAFPKRTPEYQAAP